MTDRQRIRNVVIAGGGTAGWTVAAALAKNLGQALNITLVESDEIGTVGVGESTIPTARRFHELVGVDERNFVKATGASFKLGILFEGWGVEEERYFHSFGTTGRSTWLADFHHIWLRAKELGLAEPFGHYCTEHQAALAGKFAGGPDTPLNYAYHLDATAYGKFMRSHAESLGVSRREGRIARVERRPGNGHIAALELENGQRVEGDLFIDCTGFRALLIEQELETGFEDWSQWLPTDRALAVQTERVGPAQPYTRASAHAAGWQWRIPLQDRVGNGLVYCSEFLSDDAASAMLKDRTEGAFTTEPRLIRFRTGMRRKVWNGNCIAVGLTAGFVEPLESTSIHLIMIAAIRLLQFFPVNDISPAMVERFNDVSRRELEHVRDFIILHYCLNRRDEPFWRRQAEMDLPPSLQERIAAFRERGHAYQDQDELFRVDSWAQVMLGQGLVPEAYHPFAGLIGTEDLERSLGALAQGSKQLSARLPGHDEYLKSFLG
ncbi:tryptophan halogenase family protein [Alteriqipengyuania sp. 357]